MPLNFKKVNIYSSTYNLLTREEISVATSIPVTIVLPTEQPPETRSTGPQITEVGPSFEDIGTAPNIFTFAETRDSLGLGLSETLVIEDPRSETGGTIRGLFGGGVITVNPEDGEKFVLDDFLGKLGGGEGGEPTGGSNRYGPFTGGGSRTLEEGPTTTAGGAAQITNE